MRIILGELTHAHQPVQHSRLFVAVDRAQLKIPKRQIPVAADFRFIYQHVGQAIHRLDAVCLFIHFCKIHIVPVMIKMAGFFPQINLQNLGAHDHIVTALQMFLSFPVFNKIAKQHAFRMEDDQARACLVIDLEQIQFPAQPAMVSFFRLFQQIQVIFKLLPVGKAGAVNALQHLVSFIAPPVGPRYAEQFKRLDFTC